MVGGECFVIRKGSGFGENPPNRVFMMGSAAYLPALALVDGGGGLARRR